MYLYVTGIEVMYLYATGIEVMYLYATGIEFASFYDCSSIYCVDSVVLFCFSFYYKYNS
jgi:hypothetical protein